LDLDEGRLAQGELVREDGLLIGLVIVDASLNVVAANVHAVQILTFPLSSEKARRPSILLREKISSLIPRSPQKESANVREFRSGRRTYLCRFFVLDASVSGGLVSPARVLMLERRASNTAALSEAHKRFGLTPREQETIQLLMEGLTSKEIAERMKISPSTVKAFLRLVMVKMGVSTRSGIVGKLLGSRTGPAKFPLST
jgi:DNA-binding CsgD family transcriptional regulator